MEDTSERRKLPVHGAPLSTGQWVCFLYVAVCIATLRPSKGVYVFYVGHHFENWKDKFVLKDAKNDLVFLKVGILGH